MVLVTHEQMILEKKAGWESRGSEAVRDIPSCSLLQFLLPNPCSEFLSWLLTVMDWYLEVCDKVNPFLPKLILVTGVLTQQWKINQIGVICWDPCYITCEVFAQYCVPLSTSLGADWDLVVIGLSLGLLAYVLGLLFKSMLALPFRLLTNWLPSQLCF